MACTRGTRRYTQSLYTFGTVAAAALLAGLSTTATAGIGMGKCGGGMMQGDFATQKQMMLNNKAQM